jgi:ribosomal protein RSM22 (predicted rRNA methylase)
MFLARQRGACLLLKLSRRFFPRVKTNPNTINTNDSQLEYVKPIEEEGPSPKRKPDPKDAWLTKLRKDEISAISSEDEEMPEGYYKNEDISVDDLYEEYGNIARVNETIMYIPDKIQDEAQKVFSKHLVSDIRFWSSKFLINYSQNHACEPPIDLTNLPEDRPLFANSEELNIKIKLFNVNKDPIEETKSDNKTPGEGDPKKVKLDKNITIDIEDERKLSKEKDNVNPIKIVYKPAQCVAYLQCRMPYTYAVIKRVMREIKQRMPEFQPKSILDYGAGLGSGMFAAVEMFPECLKYAAVEPNQDMRKLGKYLTHSLEKEILWVDSISMIPGAGIERGKFELIILCHVLQEIPTSKLRLMVLDTLWNRLKDDGIIIVIEPGSPKGSRFIYDLRQYFINKSRNDANIIAPCPHHFQCPMAKLRNSWCHFSQLIYKWDRTVFPKYPDEKLVMNEKFSYLVVKKGKIPGQVDITDMSEMKKITPEEKSFSWERVLRPVIRKDKHSIIDLCTTKGKVERRVIAKSHGTIGGYKTVKRVKWGDLWYIPMWLPNKFRKEHFRGKRLW